MFNKKIVPMKKMSFKLLATSFCLSLFIFASCGKAAREDAQQSSKDNSAAESAFDDIFKQVDKGYTEASDNKSAKTFTCATLTLAHYDTLFPNTLTIDFGSGCTDAYGITRSGKIIATLTKPMISVGSVTSITLENFKRNGKAITGTKTITNNGLNSSGHPVFGIEILNASVETADGIVSWNSSRTREWTEGYITPLNYLDDVYNITGTASGTNTKGNKFEVEITSPLQIELSCAHITKGVIELTPEDSKTRTLDYGNGDCDDKATLKVGNRTYDITLP